MASNQLFENLISDVNCQICLNFFTNPVIVECGHNFCHGCITQSWERGERICCPECGVEISDRVLRVNLTLRSLAAKARELSLTMKEEENKPQCDKHREELRLFCSTDKNLLCVRCVADTEHRGHRFLLIEEAVKMYKNRDKSSIENLIERISTIKEIERQQAQKIAEVQEQSVSLTSHIKSLLDDLHQILFEKEKHLLQDVRKEEQRILNPMENNLQNIKEYLTSSQLNISKLQERIQMQDSITYLKEEACGTRRISEEVREMLIKDGTLTVKKLDHARMLKAMLSEEINCTSEDTASVTLDVETAHPRLEVSEDRKSVRWIRTSCSRPDTGRRFIFGACVLGSEGFKSGRHYWEVVVRSNRRWALGVAAESVERNGRLVLKPHNGTWAIGQTDNKMYAYTTRRLELPAEPIPQRVGVLISYEAGTVSFYNVVNKSLLYTFSNFRFAEKLYPFFRTLDRNWLTIGSGSILNV